MTVLTSEDIRKAIEILKKANWLTENRVSRHYQHKKVDRNKWALYGCCECLKLIIKNQNDASKTR
jgi:hypothetical protein